MADLSGVELTLVQSIDDAMALKRWIGERREGQIAVDTESAGLNPHLHGLRLVQFGDMHRGWAIPWERWGGVVLEIMNAYEGRWTMHNGVFDWRFIQHHTGYKADWDRYDDTLTLAKLDDPVRPAGLKPLGDKLVDKTATAGQKLLHEGMQKHGWGWDTVPLDFPPYWIYAALDTVITAHLEQILKPQVVEECPMAYDLELATNRICANMMMHGMRIDEAYIAEARQKFKDFSVATREWLKTAHGITSPMSGGQLAKAFSSMGVEPLSYTDAGAPQYNKENLTAYQGPRYPDHVRELAKYVLHVRHAEKMINSYLDNFLELADSDGLVHPSINTLAARTGRMSVTDPALQTLPRDDKVIRGAFVPAEGHVWISCDLDQVEARLAAHFSRDEGLINAFLEADRPGGLDFFCGVASTIFSDNVVKGDPRRQTTKNVVYGSLYGAGAAKMAETAGVAYEQMAPVKEAFDARFPGLKSMSERLTNEAMGHKVPHIRTPLGRKLVADKGREYTQVTNALIQGHAAEYMKQALINMDAAGLGDFMRLPIHDEILLEVPRDQAEEVLRVVQDCMTDRKNYEVPITAGGGIMEERWRKI